MRSRVLERKDWPATKKKKKNKKRYEALRTNGNTKLQKKTLFESNRAPLQPTKNTERKPALPYLERSLLVRSKKHTNINTSS